MKAPSVSPARDPLLRRELSGPALRDPGGPAHRRGRSAGPHVSGIAVHIGARIASLASAGEVLVSRTVRDLVAGSNLVLRARGTHSLKGVPGDWQVYAAVPG